MKMFDDALSFNEELDADNKTFIQSIQEPCTISVSIPKVEPCCPTTHDSNEDLSTIDDNIDSQIPFTTLYKLKDPIVLLERCDKIWETLKLIKDVQGKNSDTVACNDKDAQQAVACRSEQLDTSTFNGIESGLSYIRYQPVIGNDNTALPNFKFSVKSKRKLYHCLTCGKQYTENRSLRHHSERVHGIYIPPKRYRKSNSKTDEKFDDAEKESSGVKKYDTRNNENDGNVASSLPVPKKRKSSLTNEDNDTLANGIVEEHRRKVQCVEGQQSHRRSMSHSDLVTCMLCKKFVKDIKKHLTDYHKIGCADAMLKELGKTLSSETTNAVKYKEIRKTVPTDNESMRRKSDVIIREKLPLSDFENGTFQTIQKGKEQKLNVSDVNLNKRHSLNRNSNSNNSCVKSVDTSSSSQESFNVYHCDICFGTYASQRSLVRHTLTHQHRGETKENFHLFECKYHNSPLFSRQKSNSFSTCKDKEETQEQASNILNDIEDEFLFDSEYGELETTCNCGRSFRNPHTLFIHKKYCKIGSNEENLLDKIDSPEKDSGIGISITIKKKNDSYEIVGRDHATQDTFEDSIHSQNDIVSSIINHVSENRTDIQTKNTELEILDSSKYSKDHSILRLQSGDEDIDVDIEEDLRNNINNNQKTDVALFNNLPKKEGDVKKKLEKNVFCQKVPDLKYLCRRVLARYKHRKQHTKVLTEPEKNEICLCGRRFYSKKSLNLHVTKCHKTALVCGYCNEKFDNLDKYNNHNCRIQEGKSFSTSGVEICCQICKLVLNGNKDFDEHVEMKHFDPEAPYLCHTCPKRFSSNTSRQRHFNQEHSVVSCTVCQKKCHIGMKSIHEGYHYGLGFPCHVCKKAYRAKSLFLRHVSSVHRKTDKTSQMDFGENALERFEHPCEMCGTILHSLNSLRRHVKKIHHGIYTIRCDSCHVCFTTKNALHIHKERRACRESLNKLIKKSVIRES